MSVNCISIPFRFTIMVAARTACHGGVSLGGYPDADNPDPPSMSQPDLKHLGLTSNDTNHHPPRKPDNVDLTEKGSNPWPLAPNLSAKISALKNGMTWFAAPHLGPRRLI